MRSELFAQAQQALDEMLGAGFAHAQVSVSVSEQEELNVMHNEPSLLRSTEDHELSLTGIIDSRRATMALTDLNTSALKSAVAELFERAGNAPRDDANVVSTGEKGHYEQGPLEGDMDLLALKVEELLEFRAQQTPLMQIEECAATHRVVRECVLTSGGTELSCVIGCYDLSVFGAATDGEKTSSFNYTGGVANDLSGAHASELFGIGNMMVETEKQIETQTIPGNFVGDIILAPTAIMDMLGWLLNQVLDHSLISDLSIYRDCVGTEIANERLTVQSRFDGPGHAPYSADACTTPALTLVQNGRLNYLLPSLYGSLKTGIKHTPSSSGWLIEPGETTRAELIAGMNRGALVNRLSMGAPGPNGDFSGVIKNSFLIEDGLQGHALSETMIAGNMASMLNDIVGVSEEHLDLGGQDFPWIRIANLNFS